MAVLEIEGQRVQVGDEFLSLPKDQQDATVAEIAASLKPSKVSANDVVRSAATGVPIVGGLLNKANAATNAFLAPAVEPFLDKGPETLDQPTFKERYAKSLELQNAKDARFSKEHPVVDTAAKVAGGVAGTIPLVAAAPAAFGVGGSLPSQVVRGATSGAGLSAADAAVRGEDVVDAAGIGGALGAAGPVVAKGIGKVIEKVRPSPPPVPQNTVKVGDVDIPLRPDQVSGDAAAAADAELTLRGGRGDRAQGIAQEFDQGQRDAIQKASDDLAAKLDPTGTVLRTPPQEAGNRVVTELMDQEAQRAAAETAAQAARDAQVRASGRQVQTMAGGPAASPFSAAEAVGEAVGRQRDAAVARTKGLYDEVKATPGAFDEDMVRGLSGDVRGRLTGDPTLFVDAQTAPQGTRALSVLDDLGGLGLFQNKAAPVGPIAEAAARGGASEAEKAVQSLVEKGVNPDVARNAVVKAEIPGAEKLTSGSNERFEKIKEHTREIGRRRDEVERIINENGGKYRTVDGSRLITPDLQKPDTLRLTYLDNGTPTGHFEGSARELAMEIARHETPKPVGGMGAHDVATAGAGSVRVVPRVVEASELRASGDAGYPKDLQPRDRARAASDMQVQDMSKNLNPSRLGVSSEADRGAPIVGADRVVESGNGRVMAIRQAYADGGPSAQRYRQWLADQGVDVSKFKEPVLVRERATPMNPAERKAFTVAANQSATLSMSAPERALADARILSPDVLSLIRNPGDLAAAENRDFARAFMNGVPATERAALMNAKGELSSEGVTRMRNAVLGRAYGDSPILSRIAESTSDDVRSISNGLMHAAPEWAQLRAKIASGEVPAGLDVTGDLVDAVNRTARIRGKGQGLAESKAQADAFTKQSEGSEALQRLFYDADGKKAASGQKIGEALSHYAREASKVNAAPGLDFGLAPVTASDILKGTAAKAGAPTQLAKEVAEAAAPAAKGPAIGEVGLQEMDQARKRLSVLFGDAKRAALAPGGSANDLRVMGRIMHEFDNAIIEAFEGGRFSGDSAAAAQLLKDARASHAAYRQAFSSRGPGDEIGRSVEKILGRYSDAKASPDEIMKLSYGSAAEPGGGKAARVAQRLKGILGETSPEWGAYKQGLVSHLVDTPAGSAPRSAVATADRIEKFLDGNQGRVLSQVAFNAQERAALRAHAANLRASEPPAAAALNDVDKIVAKIAGRDGGTPATPGEVVDLLFSRTGKGDKALSVKLATRLRSDLSPEGWTAVRQGMWEKLTNAGEGKIEFGPQALSQRLHEFLNESGKSLSHVLFNPAERDAMKQLASVYKQMIPPKGTTNPSGTAPMLARIANRASSNVLALLGAAHSGFPGLAVGYAADKAVRGIQNAKNARAAVSGFYGQQPGRVARSPKSVIVLSQAAAPLAANQ